MRQLALATVLLATSLLPASATALAETRLQIATFQVDATPPLGSPLCGGAVKPAAEIVDPLSARGIVLLTADKPVDAKPIDRPRLARRAARRGHFLA